MNMLRKIYLLLLCGLSSWVVMAQQKPELNLNQAVSTTLENNFGITIQKQQVGITARQNNWGAAGALPSITFVGNVSNTQAQDNDFAKKSATQAEDATIQLNWTIFRGFSARIQKDRLDKLETLSQGNLNMLVENTLVQVISSYNNLQLLKQQLQLSEKVMELSFDRYNREKERKALGSSTTYNLLQSQNAYLEDKSSYLSLQANYKVALRQLNFLMGEELGTEYSLTTPLAGITESYELEVLTERLIANNTTLQNQYLSLSLARNSVESARSAFYPSLSAGVNTGYSKSNTKFENNQPDLDNEGFSTRASLRLSYTIYSGGTRRQALDVARMKEAVSQVETAEMEMEMRKQLAQEFDLYQVRKELLSVARENYEAASLNYQISQEKFEKGAISSFNFRDVQQLFLNAGLRLEQARYNTIESYYALLRLTGGLVESFDEGDDN